MRLADGTKVIVSSTKKETLGDKYLDVTITLLGSPSTHIIQLASHHIKTGLYPILMRPDFEELTLSNYGLTMVFKTRDERNQNHEY